MSRDKARKVGMDPAHKEPSEIPGKGKPLKGSKQGNDMIKFPF